MNLSGRFSAATHSAKPNIHLRISGQSCHGCTKYFLLFELVSWYVMAAGRKVTNYRCYQELSGTSSYMPSHESLVRGATTNVVDEVYEQKKALKFVKICIPLESLLLLGGSLHKPNIQISWRIESVLKRKLHNNVKSDRQQQWWSKANRNWNQPPEGTILSIHREGTSPASNSTKLRHSESPAWVRCIYFHDRKARELMKQKGVMSASYSNPGKEIPIETVDVARNFYESDEVSQIPVRQEKYLCEIVW